MKHIILIVAAVLCVATGTVAQDTLYSAQPKEGYMDYFWPELKPGDALYYSGVGFNQSFLGTWTGIKLWTSDSVKIYGLAISAHTDGNFEPAEDTLLYLAYLTLQTMEVTPTDKYVVGEDLIIHGTQPPTYYWYSGFVKPNGLPGHRYYDPSPMYELYYSQPITVYDSFFVGGAENVPHDTCTYPWGSVYYPPLSNEFGIAGWGSGENPFPSPTPPNVYFTSYSQPQEGWRSPIGPDGRWDYEYYNYGVLMFFPILTPDPNGDTTYVPDDSTQTSVQRAVWERYVSLQPNPATDMTTVLSSVGLTAVEVFDMAGNRVLAQEASGLSAKLDVAALPRGAYIVRIHTPMGTTSRKLLLQ